MISFVRHLADLRERSPEKVLARIIEPQGRGLFHDEPITAARWAAGAASCASLLADRGVGTGDRVLLALPTSSAFVHAFWGVLSLGAIPVPLPSSGGWLRIDALERRIENIVSDAAPRAAIADPTTAGAYRRHARSFETLVPAFDVPGAELRVPNVDDSAPALIQYTSGSSGRPKGVVVTQRNLHANVEAIANAAEITGEDRVLSWLPLYHDMGLIGGLIVPASVGATACLMSPMHFLLSPRAWLQAITAYRATVTIAPNFAYSLLAKKVRDADLTGIDLSSLRVAFNGAEPVDYDTAQRFADRFAPLGFDPKAYYPVYGLAETTLAAAFPPPGRGAVTDRVDRTSLSIGAPVQPSDAPNAVTYVSVGCALPGHEITIADPTDGRTLPERHLGEIRIKGPSVTPYYFVSGEQRPDRRSALRTGDLGYLADGELYVVDRLKDLIIVAGRSYVPSDLERLVEQVPHIRTGRTVAFGIWDPNVGTEKLVVVAEVRPALLLRITRIAASVKEALEREVGLSAEVVLVRPHSLETTSSGKLMRNRARELFSAQAFEKPHGILHPTWIRSRIGRLFTKARAAREPGATLLRP